MPPALLILDLDETLVYGTETPLSRPADFTVGPFHLYVRPHLAEFIGAVADWYRLAVWTSSGSSYAGAVVGRLLSPFVGLEFVWSCERCVRRFDPENLSYYYGKDLKKVKNLGFPLERILVLDDSPEKLARNYGNHLRVKPFEGDAADDELRQLLPYLRWLRTADNFRCVEKRRWRDQVRNGEVT